MQSETNTKIAIRGKGGWVLAGAGGWVLVGAGAGAGLAQALVALAGSETCARGVSAGLLGVFSSQCPAVCMHVHRR